MPTAVLFPLDWHNIDHVVLDFGGVLYEIDHHRTAEAFAELGLRDFYLEFRHGSQSEIFDRLERGEITETAFVEHLLRRCRPGTTETQVRNAWNALTQRLEFLGQRGDCSALYRTILKENQNDYSSSCLFAKINITGKNKSHITKDM